MTTRYICDTCQTEPLTPYQLRKHLEDVHDLEGNPKGTRTPVSFSDGANGWWQERYRWKCDGYTITQIINSEKEVPA